MGASADEIDREISATRDQVDRNLSILERRAMTGARRYGAMAAIGLAAGALLAGTAYLAYRRLRKPSMSERVRGAMPDTIGDLPGSVREKFKRRPVRVVISTAEDRDRERLWELVARKVVPVIATSAVSAAVARIARPSRGTGKSSEA